MKKTFPLMTLALALTAAACGTDSSQLSSLQPNPADDQAANSAETIDEGSFKLYEDAGVIPQPFCDLHTVLKLENTKDGIAASLENRLDGVCEIAVFANTRKYDLKKISTTCGSNIYQGTLTNSNDKAANTIVITDHRERICKDIVPATIIVKETFSETSSSLLYSSNHIQALLSLEGTLTQVSAIGGESTGYGLKLANGDLVEIELSTVDLISNFSEGKKVTIIGSYKTVRGIEIPVRQVFVVKTMTAI